MFTYKYNLRALGYPEEDYDKIAKKALSLARGASAIDTGRFKNGWTTKVQGDILLVQNGVRYAPYVELGSIVYRFHRYRIRRALATLGLTQGTENFGTGEKGFSAGGKPPSSKETREAGSTSTPIITPQIQPITEQEIRSPALVARRLTVSASATHTCAQGPTNTKGTVIQQISFVGAISSSRDRKPKYK